MTERDPVQEVLEANRSTSPLARAALDVFQGDVPGRAAIAQMLDFLLKDRDRLINEATRSAFSQPPQPFELTCQECSGHWWITRRDDAL